MGFFVFLIDPVFPKEIWLPFKNKPLLTINPVIPKKDKKRKLPENILGLKAHCKH